MLIGCAAMTAPRLDLATLPALRAEGGILLQPGESLQPHAEVLLALTPQMRDFVGRYALREASQRQRLHDLHDAVRGAGALGLRYDPGADGTASSAFADAQANCLSFAHLFVALAREAGLAARYQWLDVRPRWTRVGERVTVTLHVNVMVQMPNGEQFMVDIDPLQSRDIAASRLLTDREAAALHENNIAMSELAQGNLAEAWAHGVNALWLSPDLPLLWVNLGAIYRQAEQWDAVEWALLQALQRDGNERSAMNNLALLYGDRGRIAERDQWLAKIEYHRKRNPYYHAWRGDLAAECGDWAAAREHYARAMALQPADSELLAAMGIVHYQLQQYSKAELLLEQAIAGATLHSDRLSYALQLKRVKQRQLGAGSREARLPGAGQPLGEEGSTRI